MYNFSPSLLCMTYDFQVDFLWNVYTWDTGINPHKRLTCVEIHSLTFPPFLCKSTRPMVKGNLVVRVIQVYSNSSNWKPADIKLASSTFNMWFIKLDHTIKVRGGPVWERLDASPLPYRQCLHLIKRGLHWVEAFTPSCCCRGQIWREGTYEIKPHKLNFQYECIVAT